MGGDLRFDGGAVERDDVTGGIDRLPDLRDDAVHQHPSVSDGEVRFTT
ncbi:MAG: hypothetical protein HEQ38_19860 [Gemmatimonas sp.]|nr:hypothetical protein [Gemmatimonas sp.]